MCLSSNSIKRFLPLLCLLAAPFAVAGVTGDALLDPESEVFDFTDGASAPPAPSLTEVAKIKVEVNAIEGLFPRVGQIEECIDYGTGDLGCPIDRVACRLDGEPVSCPDGGVLDGDRDMCQLDPVVDCPDGYSWDRTLDRCVAAPECRDGGVFNPESGRCEKSVVNRCDPSYTYDSVLDMCVMPADCGDGIYDAALGMCVATATHSCLEGYLYNAGENRCETAPECQPGTTYSASIDRCVSSYTIGCLDGYGYVADRSRCETAPECPVGTAFNPVTDRCEGDSACLRGTYDPVSAQCASYSFVPANLWIEWKESFDDVAIQKWVDTRNARFYVQGGEGFYEYFRLSVSSLSPKNGKHVAATVRKDNFWSGYIAVVASDMAIGRSSVDYKCNTFLCRDVEASFEWGNVYIDNIDSYYDAYAWRSNINGILGPGKHVFYRTSYIDVKRGYRVGYFTDKRGNVEFLWTKDTTSVSFESTYCPSGQYNLNGVCVANPICAGGDFDPYLDVCFTSYTKDCDENLTYDPISDSCIKDPECPEGGLLSTEADLCLQTPSNDCDTPAGWEYNTTVALCVMDPCPGEGVFNVGANRCEETVDKDCGLYLFDAADGLCTDAAGCPEDSNYSLASSIAFSESLAKCIADPVHECTGDYAYNGIPVLKCEVVPVCLNGVYDPEFDGCYEGDVCPIDPAIGCVGPAKNSWCSPHPCNAQGFCGVAKCAQGVPGSSTPLMERERYFDILPASWAAGDCFDAVCDLVANREVSYCGEFTCPQAFGVYEDGGKCYKDECPPGSVEFNGACYAEECPTGYTMSPEGICVP